MSSAPTVESPRQKMSHPVVRLRDHRLPRTFIPRHYNVRLLPFMQPGEFFVKGFVSIEVLCHEEDDKIILHCADMAIEYSSVSIRNTRTDEYITVSTIEHHNEQEVLVLKLESSERSPVKHGDIYLLTMSFTAQLSDQMKGFYYSTYQEDGKEKFVAVTQMEPTDARRAFPCFDEPSLKATFSIVIGHHRNVVALSNMPIKETVPIDSMADFVWDHFYPTLPMSTYLVAAAVGDYIRVDANQTPDTKWSFNLYVRRSAVDQAKYAKETAPKIQKFYENYFQIAFPLPKQDIIAIRDFSYEAMENWGLIVHSETALLFDEKFSSANDKQYVLELIAHELAHQWFGNYVTMDWWSDLWLNEGFANYMQYIGAEQVEPEFGMLEQFVAAELHESMAIDYFVSSHPISQEVKNPAEINEIFDLISYRKGASIIRMLVNFLGEDTFRDGLTHYLESHKFGNAVQNDLWDALSLAATKQGSSLPADVRNIMESWTLQKGYPVVTMKRDYSIQELTITQEKFKFGESNCDIETNTSLWWIPLTYTSDFKEIAHVWLGNSEQRKISLKLSSSANQWLIANVNQTGYFRVNYDVQNWKLITNQLISNCSAISAINRAQIIDDASFLARSGLLSYEVFLDLTNYLLNEEDYLPWHAAFSSFEYLSAMLSRKPVYGLFKKHLTKIIQPIYNSLGFEKRTGDSHLTIKKRALVVRWASNLGLEDCIRNCSLKFRSWMSDCIAFRIDPDLKETIIGTALYLGSEAEWDFAFQRYLESNVASEQVSILSALCSTREPWLLARMLDWTLDPASGIRKQDAPLVFKRIAANELGRNLAFSFMCERWEELKKVFVTFNSLADVVGWVTESFNTRWERSEIEKFLNLHEDVLVKKTERSILQIKERVCNNVEWMQKSYPQVKKWLQTTN